MHAAVGKLLAYDCDIPSLGMRECRHYVQQLVTGLVCYMPVEPALSLQLLLLQITV